LTIPACEHFNIKEARIKLIVILNLYDYVHVTQIPCLYRPVDVIEIATLMEYCFRRGVSSK